MKRTVVMWLPRTTWKYLFITPSSWNPYHQATSLPDMKAYPNGKVPTNVNKLNAIKKLLGYTLDQGSSTF